MLAFGKEYSTEGFRFLQIIALSGVFVGVNSVFGTVLKVKGKIKELIFIDIIRLFLIIEITYLLIDKELLGIGLAWIIGQGIVSLVYVIINIKRN